MRKNQKIPRTLMRGTAPKITARPPRTYVKPDVSETTPLDAPKVFKIYLNRGGYGWSSVNGETLGYPLEGKGEFGKRCNVTSCQQEHSAVFFNWGTSKYYCYGCAQQLKENNPIDRSQKSDGRGNYRIIDESLIDTVIDSTITEDGYVEMDLSYLRQRNDEFIKIGNPFIS